MSDADKSQASGGRRRRPKRADLRQSEPTAKRGPAGVQHGIADADKIARTGSPDESVRNTPPAGAWNDVSDD
jgi:hypothetical protein